MSLLVIPDALFVDGNRVPATTHRENGTVDERPKDGAVMVSSRSLTT